MATVQEKRDAKAIAELYEEGLTTAEIATRLKRQKSSVLRLLSYYLVFKYKEG